VVRRFCKVQTVSVRMVHRTGAAAAGVLTTVPTTHLHKESLGESYTYNQQALALWLYENAGERHARHRLQPDQHVLAHGGPGSHRGGLRDTAAT
jgi:hypothetical protein